MILANLIFILVRLSDVRAAFYSSISVDDKVKYTDIIQKTTAPSLISCALRCQVVNADADAIFDHDICSCVLKSERQEVDSKEATLTGTYLQLRKIQMVQKEIDNQGKSKTWGRLVIQNEKTAIVKGHLQTIIPKLTKEYVLLLKVKQTKWHWQMANVFSMTADEDSKTYRTPNIEFYRNVLWIHSAINSSKPKGEGFRTVITEDISNVNQWIHINVSQIADTSGKIRFTIEVNGYTWHSIINENPREFYQVKCFISNQLIMPQAGFVKEVLIDIKG